MELVSTLKKKFEEGAQALWFVGTTMVILAVFALAGYVLFQTTGFTLYEPAQHHDFVVAHADQWMRWLQNCFIVFGAFLLTGAVCAVMALVCYGIEIVTGTFKSRWAKA